MHPLKRAGHECKGPLDRERARDDATGARPKDSAGATTGPDDNVARNLAAPAKGPAIDLDGVSPGARALGVVSEEDS